MLKRVIFQGVLMLMLSGSAMADSAIRLSGAFTQGGMLTGQTTPGAKVTFDGRPVRVSKEGIFIVGFGRDAPLEHRLVVDLPDGRRQRRNIEISARKYKIQRIDGLPKKKVTPDKEALKRIRNEIAMVKKARSRDDSRTDFLTGFIWPVTGPITGVYGSQRILNGKPRRPHFGVDIAAPVGTKVVAPADGVVTLAYPDMYFSGGTLIVDHGHHLSSSFLHLSRILVKVGQRVRKGEVIAEVGATGRVTGPHLDWRMNLSAARIDPQLLAPPMPHAGPH